MRIGTAIRRFGVSRIFLGRLKRQGRCKGEPGYIDTEDIEAYFANQNPRMARRKSKTSTT